MDKVGFELSKKLKCPYCKNEMNNGKKYFGRREKRTITCPECDKTFVAKLDYEPLFGAHKAPCLNGGKHDLKIIKTAMAFPNIEYCRYCLYENEIAKEE